MHKHYNTMPKHQYKIILLICSLIQIVLNWRVNSRERDVSRPIIA